MKLYYFCDLVGCLGEKGDRPGDHPCVLVTEAGEVVRQHMCSSHAFFRYDLVDLGKNELDRRWPSGWEAVELDHGNAADLRVLAALRRKRFQ